MTLKRPFATAIPARLPEKGTLTSASVFLGADTFLGRACIGLGVGEAGRWNFYLLPGVP